jgi:hypothetical protein
MRISVRPEAVAWLVVSAALGQTPAAGGYIVGKLADSSMRPLGAAKLAIRDTDSDTPSKRIHSGPGGMFEAGPLPAAAYTVLVASPGFRARLLRGVVVKEGETTNIGTIRLEIGSCDAPGVICDSVYPDSAPNVRSQRYLELKNLGAAPMSIQER